MVLRLIESDLHRLISSTVQKILKENADNNGLLSMIVERLSSTEIPSNKGENYVDVPLDDEGNIIACIDYEIEDNRYLVRGMQSNDYDVPDDPDEVEGDYQVFITSIVIDENGEQKPIEDNGMVANALKSLINPDMDDLEYYEDDDHSGWDERWR